MLPVWGDRNCLGGVSLEGSTVANWKLLVLRGVGKDEGIVGARHASRSHLALGGMGPVGALDDASAVPLLVLVLGLDRRADKVSSSCPPTPGGSCNVCTWTMDGSKVIRAVMNKLSAWAVDRNSAGTSP